MYQKKIYLFSFLGSIILTILYILGYISHIRSILSDIITFNAAVLGFLMVFFTVLQSVISHPFFDKMEEFSPGLKNRIFDQIKSLLLWSIFLFLYILIVKILMIQYFYLKVLGVFTLFLSVLNLCIGLYFLIEDLYGTIIKMVTKKK